MPHDVERCRLPRTSFRRLNSVWSCPRCDKLWALRLYMGGTKTWMPVDGTR